MKLPRVVIGVSVMLLSGCDAKAQRDPLPVCEWCGASEAPATLGNSMVLAAPGEPGTRLIVTGTVYYADKTTPAANVLLYAYQTNAAGVYPNTATQQGNGRRHGSLRGWLRTDSQGRYLLNTIKPGPYPGRPDPMHIHMTVTPPNGDERYIDDIMFNDDPRLNAAMRARNEQRGGPGVVTTRDSSGVLYATRDIWLTETPPRVSRTVVTPGNVPARPPVLPVSRRTVRDLSVDLAQSVVQWKGTKFRGRGSHEGVVPLSHGVLRQCGAVVCGGAFTLDMTRITVTDIPASDPIPRDRLTEHLKSADFFHVGSYPTARFVATDITPAGRAGMYTVRGILTLRETDERIVFPATATSCGTATCVHAAIALDRRRWGITYRFDPVRNLIVDDTIAIQLRLVIPAGTP